MSGHFILCRMAMSLIVACCLCVMSVTLTGAAQAANEPVDPDLYSPAYYKTASPEAVRDKVKGKKLAGEFVPRNRLAGKEPFEPLPEPVNNFTDEAPVYPLNVALNNSPYPEVITVLLDAGAEMEKWSDSEYLSRENADMRIAGELFGRAEDPEKRCLLFAAAASGGHKDLVTHILGQPGMDVNCQVDDWINPPALSRVMKAGKNDMAEFLLERGADPNLDVGLTSSALSYALIGNNVEGAKLLLRHGADPSNAGATGSYLEAAAMYSSRVSDPELLAVFADAASIEDERGYRNIRAACILDSPSTVERLIARGVRPLAGKPQDCPKEGPNHKAIVDILEKHDFSHSSAPLF